MVFQRSPRPWRLLLAAALLLTASIPPAVTRGAPVTAAIPTEPAPLLEANAPPLAPADTPPNALAATTVEVGIPAGSDDAGIDYDCRYSTAHNELYLGLC